MVTKKTSAPSEAEQRRAALAAEIAGIVLQEGLEVLALRGLAERLGTSARMLMYYFGSKERLVVETVQEIVQRLQAILARFGAGTRLAPSAFLRTALASARDPAVAPFMNVLTELIARGARGEKPYDRLADELVVSWVGWIDSRLTEPAIPGQAAALLGIVEGLTLLEAAQRGSSEAAQAYLLELLETAYPTGTR